MLCSVLPSKVIRIGEGRGVLNFMFEVMEVSLIFWSVLVTRTCRCMC